MENWFLKQNLSEILLIILFLQGALFFGTPWIITASTLDIYTDPITPHDQDWITTLNQYVVDLHLSVVGRCDIIYVHFYCQFEEVIRSSRCLAGYWHHVFKHLPYGRREQTTMSQIVFKNVKIVEFHYYIWNTMESALK